MITVKLSNVIQVTKPEPFSYTGSKGVVTGYEVNVLGLTPKSGMAKIQYRSPSEPQLEARMKALKIEIGKPLEVEIRLFEVGKDNMFAVRAAD